MTNCNVVCSHVEGGINIEVFPFSAGWSPEQIGVWRAHRSGISPARKEGRQLSNHTHKRKH